MVNGTWKPVRGGQVKKVTVGRRKRKGRERKGEGDGGNEWVIKLLTYSIDIFPLFLFLSLSPSFFTILSFLFCPGSWTLTFFLTEF